MLNVHMLFFKYQSFLSSAENPPHPVHGFGGQGGVSHLNNYSFVAPQPLYLKCYTAVQPKMSRSC